MRQAWTALQQPLDEHLLGAPEQQSQLMAPSLYQMQRSYQQQPLCFECASFTQGLAATVITASSLLGGAAVQSACNHGATKDNPVGYHDSREEWALQTACEPRDFHPKQGEQQQEAALAGHTAAGSSSGMQATTFHFSQYISRLTSFPCCFSIDVPSAGC